MVGDIQIIRFLDWLKDTRECFNLPFIDESFGLAFPRSFFTSDKKKWLMPCIVKGKNIKYIILEDVRPSKAFFYRPSVITINHSERTVTFKVDAVYFLRNTDGKPFDEKISEAVAKMEEALQSSVLGVVQSIDLNITTVLEQTNLWMLYSASSYSMYDLASFISSANAEYDFLSLQLKITTSFDVLC